jgi:arginine N-succinyltransferase
LYVYHVITTQHNCPQLKIYDQQRRTLHLELIHDGPTEIGSLFLQPEFRGQGRGRFLSLSRFILLAQRPKRFADRVIAEMRGRCDKQGISPFWEAAMRPFFEVDFPIADAMSTITKSFIEELVPRFPIPLDLLSADAREVIGKVHPETEPAVALLLVEGFTPTGLIDIFDGGPVMSCQTSTIRSVSRCRSGVASIVREGAEGVPAMVASLTGGFRCVIATVARQDADSQNTSTDHGELDEQPNVFCINTKAAEHLQITDGERLWILERS